MKKLNKKGEIALNIAGWGGTTLLLVGANSIDKAFVGGAIVAFVGLALLAFAAKLNNIKYHD